VWWKKRKAEIGVMEEVGGKRWQRALLLVMGVFFQAAQFWSVSCGSVVLFKNYICKVDVHMARDTPFSRTDTHLKQTLMQRTLTVITLTNRQALETCS